MSGTVSSLAAGALGFGGIGESFARFLRPASLRGVGFWIRAAEDSTTRRWVTHEFPGRDEPWHEDLGAGPGVFAIEGLLIGDDVTRQAESMRRAAAAAGPARLVHPWYGTLQVAVLGLEVALDANEGRLARIRIKAERYGRRPAPAIGAGFAQRLLDEVDRVAGAVADTLAQAQALVALPDQAVATVLGIANGLGGAFTRGLSAGGLAGLLSGSATGEAIQALSGTTSADASRPATVSARVDAVARAVATAPQATAAVPNAPLGVLLRLGADRSLITVPADRSTPSAAATNDAAAAMAAATRAQLAARSAEAAAASSWVARDDALADRDALDALLVAAADEAAALGWDEVWGGLSALRAATLAEISDRAAPLPALRRITLPAPLPASLLAHELDGAAIGTVFARGEDIAARNRARHPGFLPASRAIEVLA